MRVATCLLLVLSSATAALADEITVSVTTDRATYAPGETVTWQTWLTLSNVANANFGVHTGSIDVLFSETGVNIDTRAIGAPFSDYTIPGIGVVSGQTIGGIGAGQFGYNADIVEVTALLPGPTLLAEGSFVTNLVGNHTISGTPLGSSQFFGVAAGFAGVAYTGFNAGSGSYATATAVPEPSTMMLGLLGAVAMMGYSRRRRAKTDEEATA